MSLPFFLAGGVKIACDLWLYQAFRSTGAVRDTSSGRSTADGCLAGLDEGEIKNPSYTGRAA
jgi:hypothetical protein